MKQYLYMVLLSLTTILTAQTKITVGEYWFDNDVTRATSMVFENNADVNFKADIPMNSLSDGLHTITFRFMDDSARWSAAFSSFFINSSVANLPVQRVLVGAEYWFDNDYSKHHFESINNIKDYAFLEPRSIEHLADGLHSMHYRFLDNQGAWSSVTSEFFTKNKENEIVNAANLTVLEYWFDNVVNERKIKPVKAQRTVNIMDEMDISALSDGLHTFHFRAMDTNGKWSSVESTFFSVPDAKYNPEGVKIMALEYWFDDDWSTKHVMGFRLKQTMNVLDQVDVSYLSSGLHTIHARFMDTEKRYASVISEFFVVQDLQVAEDNTLVAARYWFNDSVMHYIDLPDGFNGSTLSDSLSLLLYPKGEYIINIQFKDAHGFWSGAISDTLQKLSFPYGQIHFDKQHACLGDTVLFWTVLVDADSVVWDTMDKDFLQADSLWRVFDKTGSFSMSATAWDTVAGVKNGLYLDSEMVIHDLPNIQVPDSLVLYNQETGIIDAGVGFVNYFWNNVSGSSLKEVSVNEFSVGSHLMVVRVSDQMGCMNSDTIQLIFKSTNALVDLPFQSLSVYPNPASEYIALKWESGACEVMSVSILDLNGKDCLIQEAYVSDEKIDVSHLFAGQYIIKITFQKQFIVIPIIIL